MNRFSSFRIHILAAFLLFAMLLAFGMGAIGWAFSGNLGRYLLYNQAEPVMKTLMEAEQQALLARDRHEIMLESGSLAQALGWTFLVGKEVPAKMRQLGPGFHIREQEDCFILLKNQDWVPYVLRGSLGQYKAWRDNLLKWLVGGGLAGLLVASILGAILAKLLAKPIMVLSREAKGSDLMSEIGVEPAEFSENLLRRRDEIGILARALSDRQKKLHAYLRRETSFTSDVSHELRTPLAVLAGSLEILRGRIEDMPQDMTDSLLPVTARMERTVGKMSSTVRALLNLARAPQNLRLDEIDMAEFLVELIAHAWNVKSEQTDTMGGCEKRRIKLRHAEIMINIISQVRILGDRDLAAIVLGNLLDNALRYSPDGIVEVDLRRDGLSIKNKSFEIPYAGESLEKRRAYGASDGEPHGFGLSLAERACERLGWCLRQDVDKDEIATHITFND